MRALWKRWGSTDPWNENQTQKGLLNFMTNIWFVLGDRLIARMKKVILEPLNFCGKTNLVENVQSNQKIWSWVQLTLLLSIFGLKR